MRGPHAALLNPADWLAFVTLALLEIVLGIDNLIFISILVERLPARSSAGARIERPGARDGDAHRAAVLGGVADAPDAAAVHVLRPGRFPVAT